MTSVVWLVLGTAVAVVAHQDISTRTWYPGIPRSVLYSKGSITSYQVAQESTSENPMVSRLILDDGITENAVGFTQISELSNQDSYAVTEYQTTAEPKISNTENIMPSVLEPEESTHTTEVIENDVTDDIPHSTPTPEIETKEELIEGTYAPTDPTEENATITTSTSRIKTKEELIESTHSPGENVTVYEIKTLERLSESDSENEIANTRYVVSDPKLERADRKLERVPGYQCARQCVTGDRPKRCYYHFKLEWYHTMSKACFACPNNTSDCERHDCVTADGVPRSIIVVNRQLPGPSVEVCQGDIIEVDVENSMMEETTTIHWHGQHQRGTPYMDGVPYVTQCPILPKSTFRYNFRAENPGTHFWHSHTGCQRADGMFGALIVRQPEDPHSKLYDFDLSEHIIQILDWGHEMGVEKFIAHHHSNGNNKPVSLLVNGKGWVGGLRNIPPATFTVEKGKYYRFRLINAGFLNCPIEMSVDNHTIQVISSDGQDFKPVEARSLVSYAGERFDFILKANQSIANYWIRFRGLMDCDERFTSTHQVAILRYKGAAVDEEPQGVVQYNITLDPGQQVNSLNVGTGTDFSIVIPELDALEDDDLSLKPVPDMQLYISYDFYSLDHPVYHKSPYYGFNEVPDDKQQLYTPQLNHISMKLPPFSMLSQRDLLSSDMFCNESTVANRNCTKTYCECTHVIQVPLGNVVELILVDKGVTYDANHPFHLHGHAFRVVAMDRISNQTTVEEVKKYDEQGRIKRKLHRAPLKDTVTVPDGGYTVVRIHASNPGYWLFHCHIEFHVELGMSIIFKVGEHSDFTPVPRGFPQCNSYMPDEDLGVEVEEITEIDNEVPFMRLRTEASSSAQTVIPGLLSLIFLFINMVH